MRHTTTSVPHTDRGGHLLPCLSLVLILLGATCARAEDATPAQAQILAWLRELEPLPKVHYSWPVPIEKLSDELLHEYVRLTHAVSLGGEWAKPEQVDRAVSICKQVNAVKPKIPASIGINYSVWHRRFGKDLPPTDTGPTHQAELEYLKTRMEAMRTALAEGNRKHDTDVTITAVHAWFSAPERHERFAPWDKAKIAVFYPEPFGRTPHWPEHLIAYVRGAHQIKSLPDSLRGAQE